MSAIYRMIWEVLADFVAIANTAVQGNPDDTTASDFVGRHKVAILLMHRISKKKTLRIVRSLYLKRAVLNT
jgi:hypothetical protein